MIISLSKDQKICMFWGDQKIHLAFYNGCLCHFAYVIMFGTNDFFNFYASKSDRSTHRTKQNVFSDLLKVT